MPWAASDIPTSPAPVPHRLAILGLGRSPPTPAGGIEAEIALFHSYAGLLAAPPGSLKGKIAVVTQPMTRTQDGSGYGAGSTWRTRGAREAALRGAVAYLVGDIDRGLKQMMEQVNLSRLSHGAGRRP